MAGDLSLALKIQADIRQAQAALAVINQSAKDLSGGLDQLDKAAAGASRGISNVAKSAGGISVGIGGAMTAIKGLGAALAGIGAIKAVNMADDYGQMASRIKMATASAEEYQSVQERLLETANNTYRPLKEAQEVYIRTADALRGLGYNTQQALDVQDSLSYLFVVNATSADRASSAMDAFTRSLSTGKVPAIQWQTILMAVPSIVDDIAAASGKSADEIRKLGAEGKLSATMLSEGLRQGAEKNKKLAAEMPTTVADAFVKLKNSLQVFFGELNQNTGLTQLFVNAITGIARAIA